MNRRNHRSIVIRKFTIALSHYKHGNNFASYSFVCIATDSARSKYYCYKRALNWDINIENVVVEQFIP